jgi:hypothetical protein
MATSVDPLELFTDAEAFFWAQAVLQQAVVAPLATGKALSPRHMVPGIVAEAFACELYLKSLLVVEGKEPWGHDLQDLFHALSHDSQNEIRRRANAEIDEQGRYYTDGFAEIMRLQGQSPPPPQDYSFDGVLARSKDAFKIFRYRAERAPEWSDWLAGPIMHATRERILDLKPEWKNLDYSRSLKLIGITYPEGPPPTSKA